MADSNVFPLLPVFTLLQKIFYFAYFLEESGDDLPKFSLFSKRIICQKRFKSKKKDKTELTICGSRRVGFAQGILKISVSIKQQEGIRKGGHFKDKRKTSD